MILPIIYINSWPGVGKHTIAKELEKQMGGKLRVVRNHLHIDLAGAIVPRGSADYLGLRSELRSVLFRTLANSYDTHDYMYAFTDFQTTNEQGVRVATEFATAAKMRGCAFIPIILECEEAENIKRMRSTERLSAAQGGLGILTDVEILESYRGRCKLCSFQCPEELVLDVTELTHVQAAEKIVQHLKAVMGLGEIELA